MTILKAAVLALGSIFAVTTVQAAPVAVKPAVEQTLVFAQAKKTEKKAEKKAAKKAAPKKKASKKKASKAGKCGQFMYYSKKAKKCVDARDKK